MLKKLLAFFVLAGSLFLTPICMAETGVLEGDEAVAMYESKKGSAQVLDQASKLFVLIAPDGGETEKPAEMTVKVGEYFFIKNSEDKVVHNVYDETDHSWVLKKQQPGGIAAIAFGAAGEHKLRCAIHPKMRILVKVVE